MRVDRRDFLLLRAGQPAVLSCEQLFMRYLDSQIDDRTPELFAHLAADLRAVKTVQLVDTSWRARADFDQQLEAVLSVFAAAGGRIVAALIVAIASIASADTISAAGAKVAPKSGAAMCVLT